MPKSDDSIAGACLHIAYDLLKEAPPGPTNPPYSRCTPEQKIPRIVAMAKLIQREWESQEAK